MTLVGVGFAGGHVATAIASEAPAAVNAVGPLKGNDTDARRRSLHVRRSRDACLENKPQHQISRNGLGAR